MSEIEAICRKTPFLFPIARGATESLNKLPNEADYVSRVDVLVEHSGNNGVQYPIESRREVDEDNKRSVARHFLCFPLVLAVQRVVLVKKIK